MIYLVAIACMSGDIQFCLSKIIWYIFNVMRAKTRGGDEFAALVLLFIRGGFRGAN